MTYFSVTLNGKKTYLNRWNRLNNGSVLLTITSTNFVCLQMARMEMDCNLKKLAYFFKFLLCILENSLKTDYR